MKVFTAAGQDLVDLDVNKTVAMISYFSLFQSSPSTYYWLLDQLVSTLEFCDEPTLAESWAEILGSPEAHERPVDFLRRAFTLVGNSSYKRLGVLRRMDYEYMDKEEADTWLNELGSLHFIEHTEPFGRVGPLSLHSMDTPTRLNNFRNFLDLAGITVEEFVKGEIPLVNEACTGKQDPWTEETLTDLLYWDFERLFLENSDKCTVCKRHKGCELVGEDNAAWTLGIEQIKRGRSPDGPLEGEEEKAYRRWIRYMERWRVERICKDCQDEERMTGDGNFESSPFLLDI